MPLLPVPITDKLIVAGEKQIDTGMKLKRSATHLSTFAGNLNNNGEIVQTITVLRDGATSVRVTLAPVASALTFIGNALRAIAIPTVTPTYTTVVGIRVVTGIRTGNVRPFTTTATRFETMAENITIIRTTLQTSATSLGRLLNRMPAIQTDLSNASNEMNIAGDDMIEAGTAIKGVGELLSE